MLSRKRGKYWSIYLREERGKERGGGGGGAADRPQNYDSRTRKLPIPGRLS